MNVNRKCAADIATDTLNILEQGHYFINGKKVDVSQALQNCVKETFTYPPESVLTSDSSEKKYNTVISVVEATTLMAIKSLCDKGLQTVALNFASAKNPGGGFRNGARAQEESLARSSGLYKSIVNNEMYWYHRSRKNHAYSDYAIYSSDVPVFKKDDGSLWEEVHKCSFITCPAVNRGAMKKRNEEEIQQTMLKRVRKVVTLAAMHGNEACVFGAWGCGVFRNEPKVIAQLFSQVIREEFPQTFREIVFAIVDNCKGYFIKPFVDTFENKTT